MQSPVPIWRVTLYSAKILWSVVLAGVCASQASSADFNLIGVTLSGTVVSINPATGAGTAIGPSGYVRLNSLARDSSGTLYAANDSGANQLLTINPSTGLGTSVGTLNFGLAEQSVRALAFSGSDVLYAINDGGGVAGTTADDLYVISLSTTKANLVGSTGINSLQGLDFSPQGVLYGWDCGSFGLVTIDPMTGLATDVNPSVNGTTAIQSITFGPDGKLYGGRDSLFQIDIATGVPTLLGSGGYTDIRGLEVVPEPSTIALAVLGSVLFFFVYCRRPR